jgi:hypothetical protein
MAQKERERTEEIARINGEWAEKLQQEKMKFDRKQGRTSFWRQLILVVVSAILGFITGWLLKP